MSLPLELNRVHPRGCAVPPETPVPSIETQMHSMVSLTDEVLKPILIKIIEEGDVE